MKCIFIITALFLSFAFAVSSKAQQLIPHKGNLTWIRYDHTHPIPHDKALKQIRKHFRLNKEDSLQLVSEQTDHFGFSHSTYRQLHKGIPVEGCTEKMHYRHGTLLLANGKLIGGIQASPVPALHPAEALEKARSWIPSERYAWEMPAMETLLKKITADPSATFFPTPVLVYADPDFCSKADHYRLCYKIDLYGLFPETRQNVFIDANDGSLLLSYPTLLNTDVSAQAVTKYSGLQNIITDSVAADTFYLQDNSRGGGIETLNLHHSTDMGMATEFYDADNFWNNFNSNQDEAATDAHWGLEMTYDYFALKHNRNSYDGNGSKLIANVHYDTLLVNAFWNGQWASFGDGDNNHSALTSLDVVAHEITHGVTAHSASLIYLNESGALNESFSDIFGSCVEFYAAPDSFDWYIGEDFDLLYHTGFRNMADPKSKSDPDTYHGQYWYYGTMDNGGVHINSGVQNHWFYLLANGGAGTNDKGDSYNISGLGMDTAAAIAYRNLSVYLSETSTYWDARLGAIQAAEDLYGPCSDAVIQTAEAWYAVGVGTPIADRDIYLIDIQSPVTACGLDTNEQLIIRFRYNGCGSPLLIGDSIPFAFKLDNNPIERDTLILSSPMAGGDSMTFTFSTPLDLSAYGLHQISCWTAMQGDSIQYNDSVTGYTIYNHPQQNFDLGIYSFFAPVDFCHLGNAETIGVHIRFYGCDSLPSGTEFICSYRVNGGPITSDTIWLANTLYPGNDYLHLFGSVFDASAKGKYLIEAWTDYPPDTIQSNDSLTYLVSNPELLDTNTLTFEDSLNVQDSMIVLLKPYADAFIDQQAAKTGLWGFRMTGSDIYALDDHFFLPDTSDIWNAHPDFDARLCFCVDAGNWATVKLAFDLKQTYAPTHKIVKGLIHAKRASSLRVLADEIQKSKTYHPKTYINDTFVTRTVNLNSLAGSTFQLCFETMNYLSESTDIVPWGKGDNAFIDNIRFLWTPLGVPETKQKINLFIYPNPGSGLLNLMVSLPDEGDALITVFDLLGNKVFSCNKYMEQGANLFSLDLTKKLLGAGILRIYFHHDDINSIILIH